MSTRDDDVVSWNFFFAFVLKAEYTVEDMREGQQRHWRRTSARMALDRHYKQLQEVCFCVCMLPRTVDVLAHAAVYSCELLILDCIHRDDDTSRDVEVPRASDAYGCPSSLWRCVNSELGRSKVGETELLGGPSLLYFFKPFWGSGDNRANCQGTFRIRQRQVLCCRTVNF